MDEELDEELDGELDKSVLLKALTDNLIYAFNHKYVTINTIFDLNNVKVLTFMRC